MTPALTRSAAMVLTLLLASPAFAHSGGHPGMAGLLPGLLHPWSGLGHVLPALAVGAWGVQAGGRAAWVLPAAFLAALAVGSVSGATGVAVPGVHAVMAASALVFGLALLLAARPAVPMAAALVAGFALFHGQAHGAALPPGADAVLHGFGAFLSTAALVGAGGAAALALPRQAGHPALRGAGVALAASGLVLLRSAVG